MGIYCHMTRQKLGAATFDLLRGVPEKHYEKAFNDWVKRFKLCVSL